MEPQDDMSTPQDESGRNFVHTPPLRDTIALLLEQGQANNLDPGQMLSVHGRILSLLAEGQDTLTSALNKNTSAVRAVQREAGAIAATLAPFQRWSNRIGAMVLVGAIILALWIVGKVSGDMGPVKALWRFLFSGG